MTENHITYYDIIPDIHADASRLAMTLEALGYRRSDASWEHPDGRLAAFLGDFIDTGSENRIVIETVRSMVENGNAVAIMGNHELNALHYHTKCKNRRGVDDGYMRPHLQDNNDQHETFLEEYPVGGAETQEVLDWFLTLPLFLDLNTVRLVHACWDATHIDLLTARRGDGRLLASDLQEVAFEQTDFAKAVVNLLKGPEVRLPEGYGFDDYKGKWRKKVRIKWWAAPDATWGEASLSVPATTVLPEGSISSGINTTTYATEAPPVFFGHYKRPGRPRELDAHNVLCLDYPETPCAYRWLGERNLNLENFVTLGGRAEK